MSREEIEAEGATEADAIVTIAGERMETRRESRTTKRADDAVTGDATEARVNTEAMAKMEKDAATAAEVIAAARAGETRRIQGSKEQTASADAGVIGRDRTVTVAKDLGHTGKSVRRTRLQLQSLEENPSNTEQGSNSGAKMPRMRFM